MFNVQSVRKANDLAYTPHALAAHTDNPYRKPIPGIQILHCIKNDSKGGHSTLTDGFAVAEYLRKKHKIFLNYLLVSKLDLRMLAKTQFLKIEGETIELNKNGSIKRVRLSPRLDYVPINKRIN